MDRWCLMTQNGPLQDLLLFLTSLSLKSRVMFDLLTCRLSRSVLFTSIACAIVLAGWPGFDCPSANAADGKLHALVIGNGDYRTGKLRNPANDAKAISTALRGLGFQVSELTNVGQQETEDAILQFSRSINDDGLAFFFFADSRLRRMPGWR